MKQINHTWMILFIFFLLASLFGCVPAAAGGDDGRSLNPSSTPPEFEGPTETITPTASASPTITRSPTHCPIATQEIFQVAPVTSPTDQLSQVIDVHIGLGEEVTVITESGTFTDTDSPFQVEISLLPNTVHHLEVIGKVKTVVKENGCIYGGHSFSTTRDSQGAPLTIVQGDPVPRPAGSLITAENATRLEELTSFAEQVQFATDFVFRDDSKAIISVGGGSNISVWSLDTGEEVRQPGTANASAVAITSDGSLVATSGLPDNIDPWNAPTDIQLWNTLSGEMIQFRFDQRYPESIAFNPSGTRLAAGNGEDSVTVWDVGTQQLLINFKGDEPLRLQLFRSLYWKDDSTLVVGGSDAIYWWDTTTGSLLQRLAISIKAQFFVDVAFGPNADRLAGAAQDAYVYFWDRRVETWSRWPVSPDSRITRVCFSPDGQLLVGGTNQGQMLIWNVETQQLLAQYSMLNKDIEAIRFSPDGRYIAIGGGRGPIRLWGIP